jgi:hypothetical protein
MPKHITVKFLKTTEKEKNLQKQSEKKSILLTENKDKNDGQLTLETQ